MTAIVLFALVAMSSAEAVNPVKSALVSGGQRLAALQNADGGWFFFVGDPDCGLGAGVSCPNTFGVTGLGLLASNAAKRDSGVRAAAIDTGVALVAFFTAAPIGDGDPTTSADRPYSQDIEFLMELSDTKGVPGRSTYEDVAKAWFANTIGDFPIANDRVTNRIARRATIENLAGWDTASDIRAALETGNRAYAKALALAIVARASEWNYADPDCDGCELYSMGSLIWAIQDDGLRGDSTLRAAAKSYRDTLLGLQAPNGSWNGDTQLTAYVVLGFEELSGSKAVNKAIKNAVTFLLSMANGDGGFGIGVGFEAFEITEVDSEVLQALEAGLD